MARRANWAGCWTRRDGAVTLYASRFATGMEDPGKFNRLDLTIASDGKLMRRFDIKHIGAYARQ
jgi:hypothetical protein